MKSLDLKSMLWGGLIAVVCLAVVAAKGVGGASADMYEGRFALLSHTWKGMPDTRVKGAHYVLGLFRVDKSSGKVWALVSQSDRREDVQGWVSLGDTALESLAEPE